MTAIATSCERCGEPLPSIDVAMFGRAESLTVSLGACACPGPRCPWCHERLDMDYCVEPSCWAWGLLIPLPEIA